MRNRVLFVTEKFCDGTPNLGLTNNFHNLFNTFSEAVGHRYNWNTLHLDEAAVSYRTHINDVLPIYCMQWDINIVIFCLLGQSPCNPSMGCYKALKELGVYLCFTWPDTGPGWATDTIAFLDPVADLHISWDNPRSTFHDSWPKRPNHMFLWVPQDTRLFYRQPTRTVPVSFIGSPRYADRAAYLNHLKSKLPHIPVMGGQREDKFTPERYAEEIRNSQIGINFPLSPAMFWQTKGRIFEIMACGSMLLEMKNPSTESLFVPGQDYVEFTTTDDFVDKVAYYTEHHDEREKIAEQGWIKYNSRYTARHYWEAIMNRIDKERNG